ncbi:HSP20-like chaperone [Ceratobasidium sp. AG-I]|nr:HSP20-like chaperone [Ceratobasidium sp. AG-I]
MSLTRSLLNDFRPLFRMLEDPLMSAPFSRVRPTAFEPFSFQRQASVEVSEDGNDIVVQAEVPGVQRENLDVHLGNNGQSLTIEGRVHRLNKSNAPAIEQAKSDAAENATQGGLPSITLLSLIFTDSCLSDVVQSDAQPPAESEFRSSFTRTLWLPQRVDGQKASAQLADGILTLRIPKVSEPAAERIPIN